MTRSNGARSRSTSRAATSASSALTPVSNGPSELQLRGFSVWGEVLATVSLPYTAIPRTPAWVAYDFSSFGIAVVEGQVISITVRTPGGPNSLFSWGATEGDEYAGGARYVQQAGLSDWAPLLDDAGFRTFVEAVPEPSVFALLALGLVACGRHLLRRGRRPRESWSGT